MAAPSASAIAENPYVQRIVEDEDLRDSLRNAYVSGRRAYVRLAGQRHPVEALMHDKRTQKELRKALRAAQEAGEALRAPKRKRRRGLVLLVLAAVAAAAYGLRR